eukprot:scaffold12968_cov66-Phaeocystis_antarctica.AAC.3
MLSRMLFRANGPISVGICRSSAALRLSSIGGGGGLWRAIALARLREERAAAALPAAAQRRAARRGDAAWRKLGSE